MEVVAWIAIEIEDDECFEDGYNSESFDNQLYDLLAEFISKHIPESHIAKTYTLGMTFTDSYREIETVITLTDPVYRKLANDLPYIGASDKQDFKYGHIAMTIFDPQAQYVVE